MKRNDNSKEERKGFWRIGYLEQQDYIKRMLELTHREMLQPGFDEKMDEIIAKGEQVYYDDNFEKTDEPNAVYMAYDTGENAYRTNNNILAGFHRNDSSDDWRGVYLKQDENSLRTVLNNQRQRRALEDYSYIYHYDRVAEQCDQFFGEHQSIDIWANHIGQIFVDRQSNGEIYSFDSGSYFKSDEKSVDGEELFFWMERNDKPGARQKGFGIALITIHNLLEKWSENSYDYTLDRLIFNTLDELEEFVNDVAENAMEENWSRINAPTPEHSYGHPVLKSYIEYTLVRLRILDRKNRDKYIIRSDKRVFYNTGLLNEFFRQILVSAELKIQTENVPGIGDVDFEFFLNPEPIVAGNDNVFPSDTGELKPIPRIANYFEKKEDVLYDASLEIMLNDEHIFEDGLRAGRIPVFYEEYQRVRQNQDDLRSLVNRVQARVETAIHRAQLLAERNHKLAVPQFWKEDAEVQFLLPLYMEETHYTGRPQCALALRRGGNGSYYEGATILSLDMAYNNARLIAKPDVTWLNRENGLEVPSCRMACDYVVAEVEEKYAQQIIDLKKQLEIEIDSDTQIPGQDNIGKIANMSDVSLRQGGRGLRGLVLNSVGTVAGNLLDKSKPMPEYVGGSLKVKIIEINPQGTQYILEPLE